MSSTWERFSIIFFFGEKNSFEISEECKENAKIHKERKRFGKRTGKSPSQRRGQPRLSSPFGGVEMLVREKRNSFSVYWGFYILFAFNSPFLWSSMVTVDTKNYPYYNFPPFYTYFFESKRVVLSPFGYRLQETSILINQQLDTWCKIIKEYYTDRKNMFIDLKPYELDVFNNTSINSMIWLDGVWCLMRIGKAEEKLIKAIFDNLVMQCTFIPHVRVIHPKYSLWLLEGRNNLRAKRQNLRWLGHFDLWICILIISSIRRLRSRRMFFILMRFTRLMSCLQISNILMLVFVFVLVDGDDS